MNSTDEFARVVARHAEKYPLMQAQDAVKLAYQNVFGGGHLISDPEQSLSRLRSECAALPENETPGVLLEGIGNGLVRVQLRAYTAAGLPLEELNAAFAESAARHTGCGKAFKRKLLVLKEAAEDGILPFRTADLTLFLEQHEKCGCPGVSHSEAYRKAYRPAYRVVLKELIDTIQPLTVQSF